MSALLSALWVGNCGGWWLATEFENYLKFQATTTDRRSMKGIEENSIRCGRRHDGMVLIVDVLIDVDAIEKVAVRALLWFC